MLRESLEAIYNAGYEILAVVTNPDKPKGRGMKMIASPVKEFAIEKNLKIYQPEKVRNNTEFIDEHKKIKSRCYMCCSIWKNITKRNIRNSKIWLYKCTWITYLPKYRGAAPIQWAVFKWR